MITSNSPRAASKKELFEQLKPITKGEIRVEILEIVKKNRNISDDKALRIKLLRRNEVKELLEQFGF